MAKFKIIISDPKKKKVTVLEIEDAAAHPLIGKELGNVIEGPILGLDKGLLKITGGIDKDGIPLRHDVHGGGKKKILVSGGVGFKSRKEGERRRKMVRGRMITEDTYVINMIIQPKKKKQSSSIRKEELTVEVKSD